MDFTACLLVVALLFFSSCVDAAEVKANLKRYEYPSIWLLDKKSQPLLKRANKKAVVQAMWVPNAQETAVKPAPSRHTVTQRSCVIIA